MKFLQKKFKNENFEEKRFKIKNWNQFAKFAQIVRIKPMPMK